MATSEYGEVADQDEAQEGARLDSVRIPIARQKDQTLLLTDPESQQYLELMQEFTQYMQRWKDVLFSPQYEVIHNSREDRGESEYEFDIIQTEGKQHIVPTSEDNENSDIGIARVSGKATYDIAQINRRKKEIRDTIGFTVTALRPDSLPLIDPDTNEPLNEVSIYAHREQVITRGKKGVQEPGTYDILITIADTEFDKPQTSPYSLLSHTSHVAYTLNQRTIEIERELTNPYRPPILNPHARALFQLVDSFIPKQEPQPANTQSVPITRPPRRP